ncbi:hypothetical protein WDA79_00350 [Streptomyces sp. A475]
MNSESWPPVAQIAGTAAVAIVRPPLGAKNESQGLIEARRA